MKHEAVSVYGIVTLSDSSLDSQIGPLRRSHKVAQRPGTRHEVVLRVFSVDSCFNCMTIHTQLVLIHWQLITRRYLRSREPKDRHNM